MSGRLKAPPPDAPEGAIQSYIVQEMEKLGLVLATVNYTTGKTNKAHTTEGFPDLVVIGGGRVHLWECKTQTGVLSPAQRLFHKRVLDEGHYYIPIVRSLDDALLYYQRQFKVDR